MTVPSRFHGAELKRRREGKGWSQRELARRAGLRHGTVQYLERRGELNQNCRGILACARALRWRPRHPKPEPVELLDIWADVTEAMERILKRKYGLTRPKPKAPAPQTCDAKTRQGHPCRNKPMPGKRRCKFHGGMSTGPRTAEGREKLSRLMRERRARERQRKTSGGLTLHVMG